MTPPIGVGGLVDETESGTFASNIVRYPGPGHAGIPDPDPMACQHLHAGQCTAVRCLCVDVHVDDDQHASQSWPALSLHRRWMVLWGEGSPLVSAARFWQGVLGRWARPGRPSLDLQPTLHTQERASHYPPASQRILSEVLRQKRNKTLTGWFTERRYRQGKERLPPLGQLR